MDWVPGAVPLSEAEVVEDDAVGGKIVGQGTPNVTLASMVEDGIDDLALAVLGGPFPRLGRKTPGADPLPWDVR
jgi:hypothetical protein